MTELFGMYSSNHLGSQITSKVTYHNKCTEVCMPRMPISFDF